MKKKYLLIFMFMLSCIAAQTYSQLVFLNQFNGGGGGGNVSNAITSDASGNSYVTGYTTGIGSMHDITTIKYNPSGRLLWSRTYNGPGNNTDEAYAITLDASNNVYITGTSVGLALDKDMVIIKYSNSGVQQWINRYSSPGSFSDEAYAITIDGSNNPVISGYSNVLGVNLLTVIKYNPAGGQLWLQTGGGSSGVTDVAYAITVDESDNLYVTGYSKDFTDASTDNKSIETVKFNSSGQRQWSKTLSGAGDGDNEPSSMVTDHAGNTYVTGYVTAANGFKDYVTAKYDKNGVQKWMKTYNNPAANSDDIARKLVFTDDGDVVVTGSSKHNQGADGEDYFTICYNKDGNQKFTNRYKETANSQSIAYNLIEYKSGKYYITGSSRQTTSSGSEDIVTIELDDHGTVKHTYKLNHAGKDAAFGITADDHGDFMIAGYLNDISAGDNQDETTNMVCAMYSDGAIINSPLGISLNKLETVTPGSFSLYQNYPNPFNPSTVIKFDVSQSSNVKISIYDILGKEVLTPVNDYMNPGTYEVSVSLSNLSSGLYFYKMTSGNFTDIKKLMLTK